MKPAQFAFVALMAIGLPIATFAQSSADVAYCNRLASLARTYGSNSGPVPEAISKCGSDTQNSISLIEKHLQADKIKLPPR